MKTLPLLVSLLLLGISCQSFADEHKASLPDNGDKSVINVGVIVDVESWVGKVVQNCIRMAVSDFYNLNRGYRTRIVLHVRDSKGNSLHSIAAALELLENVEVQAIIIPEVTNKELFLTKLGNKVNVPLLSFSSIVASSNEHPYFIQVAEDENNQFHGIAALLQAFRWRSFVFLYEDTADARQAQTYINDILQENHLDIGYQTAISLQSTDDQIIDELHKLMMMKASIILVHLSSALAAQVLRNAKMLGLMSKGFAWIMTSKTMDLLGVQDSSVYESMQGVLGFKSYPYASNKMQNFISRWRRGFEPNESNVEIRSLNAFGVWAYDAAWLLAEALERTGIELSQNWAPGAGSAILRQITSSKFTKTMGKSQLGSRKLVPDIYEIVNIIHKGEIKVGFWASAYGFTTEINPSINSSSNMLETIIWPGFSLTAPESLLVQMSRRILRIGVPLHGRFPELVGLQNDSEHNVIISGFCIDVFKVAVSRLPYNISYEYVPFNNQNGSYNDLVYQVYKKKVDAAVGDITILSNRSAYVDFTLPFSDLGVGVVVKLDDNDPWFFLKPLKADLWIISGCFFFLTGFIVWLIEHRINEEFQGPPARQVGTALWFAFSTLVYAHRERLQSNVSRFVVGVWLFVVLILTSSYIAKLSSLLTVEQIKLTKGDYIGYSANSIIKGIAGGNLNFKDNRLKPFQSPDDYDKALRKGNRKGGVRAIVEELPYLKIFVARFPNDYVITETSMVTSGFGFAFPKGSPLVPDISKVIAELREEGELLKMEKKWFSSHVSLTSEESEAPNKANPLSKENFLGLFLISAISISIAILILIVFLIGEKLSFFGNLITVLAGGKMTLILNYLYAKMANIIDR
ncbi:hypothetical protein ACS0TY_008137 [Phlomoides rotata]